MPALCVGVNGGEWAKIRKTGDYSSPDKMDWEEWSELTTGYRLPVGWRGAGEIAHVRNCVRRSFIFTFIAYEGEMGRLGSDPEVVPVIGPGWGASSCLSVGWLAVAFGVLLFVWGANVRRKIS